MGNSTVTQSGCIVYFWCPYLKLFLVVVCFIVHSLVAIYINDNYVDSSFEIIWFKKDYVFLVTVRIH